MDVSIRKLHADEREERCAEIYQAMYDQILAEQRAEYEAEFGEVFRAAHPFKPNGPKIHVLAMQRLHQEA